METKTFNLAQQPVCEQNRPEEINSDPKSWSESQLRSLPRFANREVSVKLYMFKMASVETRTD